MHKPILCLDFDGVLHSYKSGWKGARNIPDPPVPGALQFLVEATKQFNVYILSSRSHQFGGRRAMKKWIIESFVSATVPYKDCPEWLRRQSVQEGFADLWEVDAKNQAKQLLAKISFPKYKPPAFVTLDDRAMQFTGCFPTLEVLRNFQPWTKQPV